MFPKDRKRHPMIKVSFHQEDIIINIYASNDRATKYMELILTDLKGEIYCSTIIGEIHSIFSNK